MNRRHSKRNAPDLRRALVLGMLVMLCLSGIVNPRQVTESKADKAKIRQRVTSIIQTTLARGEMTTPEGQRIMVRANPEDKEIEEIRSYGDETVVVLGDFLKSENAREYELAMRLLGALGGERIVQPLGDIALRNPSPRKREYALRWLTQAPWENAEPIISLSAKTDHDTHVRVVAKELLSNYDPSRTKAAESP